jgi:hypothetical protein
MKTLLVTAIGSLILLFPALAYADSAQWNLNPTSGDWNTAANWAPMTVPNGPGDTATFDLSNTTNVSISGDTEVNGITFTAAATNPYTITASPGLTLTVSGIGVANNSATTKNSVTAVNGNGNRGQVVFLNSATAGASTLFINSASVAQFVQGGETAFYNTSSAADGTFADQGGTLSDSEGGGTSFYDSSTAGSGRFTNSGGMTFNTFSAATVFNNTSTAGDGTFTNDGGSANFADGG